MKIQLINRQKIKKINIKKISAALIEIAALINVSPAAVTFCLCDDEFIKRLNKKYFNRSSPTDVIAFSLADKPVGGYLGEVVVSVERAVIVAKEVSLAWQKELLLYLIHGMLHLTGYDDTTSPKSRRMRAKEQEVLACIGNNV